MSEVGVVGVETTTPGRQFDSTVVSREDLARAIATTLGREVTLEGHSLPTYFPEKKP